MLDPALAGIARGAPLAGPRQVHVDITNGCNAACLTCWDHSPLLAEPRPADWKRRRMSLAAFTDLLDQLDALGSVRAVVVSGMGDPLTHPDVYTMLAACKQRRWHVTLLTNLLAADIDALCAPAPGGGPLVDNLLASVQGVTPDSYVAFHPGWTERHFFTLCGHLRRLGRAGVSVRHVQVIDRNTAPEVVEMVRFAHSFKASRVNYKLASLYAGTEQCGVTAEQRDWLEHGAIPEARALAADLGVATNLDLFEAQVRAAGGPASRGVLRATTPIAEVGCFMGYAYTRVTVDQEVLYCCNTEVSVGHLHDGPLAELWQGERWQALRDRLRGGDYFPGCDVCGKFEQNVKWSARVRRELGEAAWLAATGRATGAAK